MSTASSSASSIGQAPPPVWTVLGSGSILPRAGYGCSGHALRAGGGGPLTLFDCGPGTLRVLGALGHGVRDVERVVVSHFHPDHVLDLFALAFARRNPALGALPPLELVGPRGLGELLERGGALYGARTWTRFRDARVVEVEPREGAGELAAGPWTLRWAPTGHTEESLAWRAADARGRSIAYTGDTPESDAVARLAAGADVLVAECSFADEEAVPGHLTPSSAARLASAAGVGRLVLTHFYPGLDPAAAVERAARTFAGPIEAAHDGSAHAVGAPG